MHARLAHGLADQLLADAELVQQTAKTLGFLDWVEVLALQILHQARRHGIDVG